MTIQHHQPIIALDIGRSAVKAKAYFEGALTPDVLFPSVVVRGHELSMADTQSAAHRDIVDADGQLFFVGETARIQGEAESTVGLSHDWVETTQYRVLVQAALNRLKEDHNVGDIANALVIVGTPSSLFSSQRRKLEEITRAIVGCEVKALPQPMGAYLQHVYDDGGVPIPDKLKDANGRRRTWAVVEVGYYTTDFLLMSAGQFVEAKAQSCKGLQVACEQLTRILGAKRGITTTPLECQDAIRTKTIFDYGTVDITEEVNEAVQFVVDEILSKATGLFARDMRQFDGIVIAGGGAPVVGPALEKEWRNAVTLKNPRTAVVDGYIKFGRFQAHLKRAEQRAAQAAVKA